MQTGFGPFVSVYLTAQRWTQFDIGLVLSAAGIVSLVGQMPGGAVVDAARSERFVAGIAIVAICVSALTYAALPIFPMVLAGSILHALASCVLGPAMAAISLGLVGHAAIGERLGRNARFRLGRQRPGGGGDGRRSAICFRRAPCSSSPFCCWCRRCWRYAPSRRARSIPNAPTAPCRGAAPRSRGPTSTELMRNRPLLIFAGCLLLFHLANAPCCR